MAGMKDEMFGQERFLRAQRDAFLWRAFGALGLLTGLAGVAAVALLVPLKEVRPVPFGVDAETKLPVPLFASAAQEIDQMRTLIWAEAQRYVIDRETYDRIDNKERLDRIVRRSRDEAQQSYRAVWDHANAQHPDIIYGANTKVTVKVLAISDISGNVIQVRLKKRLKENLQPAREATYVAVLEVGREAEITATSQQKLLDNPLGFYVTSYRLTPELAGTEGDI